MSESKLGTSQIWWLSELDKWFYVNGIPCIHSNTCQSFDNEILEHLDTLHEFKESTTTSYNPCGNATFERFNHMLHDFLRTLDKEQKASFPLHVPILVFAYNANPHSVTGYKPYELMLGHKAPTLMYGFSWKI